MILSALTPRRRETLAELRHLTAQAGDAVHYSLLAARMRISAWTAYGLLRDLESMGLVRRRYAREPGAGGGRSRILFAPTSPDAVRPASEALREAFERFRAIADERTAARAYLATPGDLAYQLGFWLGRLEAAGREAAEAGRTILEGGLVPAAKVRTVAALGLGSALSKLGSTRMAARLTEAVIALSQLVDDDDLAGLVDSARSLPAAT